MMRSPFSASAIIARYRGSKICSGRDTPGNSIVTSSGKMGIVDGSSVCAPAVAPHNSAATASAQLNLLLAISDPLRHDWPKGDGLRRQLLSQHGCRAAEPRAAGASERIGSLVRLILHRLVQADEGVAALAHAGNAVAQR